MNMSSTEIVVLIDSVRGSRFSGLTLSTLLIANKTLKPNWVSSSIILSAFTSKPRPASIKKTIASASLTLCHAASIIARSNRLLAPLKIPGVSDTTNCADPMTQIPLIRERVV